MTGVVALAASVLGDENISGFAISNLIYDCDL
jgi:hypothetical protein